MDDESATAAWSATSALLRQLAIGLSSYRLFPGDLEQDAFVAAVGRVRAAAEHALVVGPVQVQVHGEGFGGARGEELRDETAARLAAAMFDRRAELFEIRGVPDRHDLGALYGALTDPVEDVVVGGGVGSRLRRSGVTTLAASAVEPEAAEATAVELTDDQRALWSRLLDPAGFAANLLVEGLGGALADQAEAVYRRFRALLAQLPDELAGSPDAYRQLHQVAAHLPGGLRRSLIGLLVGRVETDQLAQGFLGTMTGGELAHALVELGEDGPHPVDLARRLVDAGIRQSDVIDLTSALLVGGEHQGTIVAGMEGASATGVAASAVSEVLARGVSDHATSDAREIRQIFPADREAERELALPAIRDYLRVERDRERLGLVLASWTEAVRNEVRAGRPALVERLVHAVDVLRVDGDPELAALVDAYHGRVLDDELVLELVERGQQGDVDVLTGVLEPFGVVGISRFLDVLGEAEDQGTRAQLVAFVGELARTSHGDGRVGAVGARLGDPRWYVVRNAVTILQRIGTPETVPLLVHASRHETPAVRVEATRALVAVAGAESVPYLQRLAGDPDASVRRGALLGLEALSSDAAAAALADLVRSGQDTDERTAALERLARHPSATVPGHLTELAARSGRPKLPWRLRRRARRLARERSR